MTGEGRSQSTPGVFAPSPWLVATGLLFLGLGLVLGVAYAVGDVQSSLFPAGWIFPAVLIVTGVLMAAGRRFDITATLWGGLALGVFVLDVLVYVNALDRGLDDPAAFDPTVIVAAFGLVVLFLRPRFRS
ncbi:hypothetical protein BH24CHL9_BH24CHL9_15920 [soil metagenome]